jgi:hypothetical protein
MDRVMPRPPLSERIPSGVWAVLTWGAALVFAVLVFAVSRPIGPPQVRPASGDPGADQLVRLGLGGWAGIAVSAALPIGLARRLPLSVLGLVAAESLALPGGRDHRLLT